MKSRLFSMGHVKDANKPKGPSEVHHLTSWEAAIRHAGHRARALEASGDPKQGALIPQLSELEVYLRVKALGVEDATDILALMRPKQIRSLFDFEIWERDHLASADLISWLMGFQEAGFDALLRAAQAMDPEVLALFLRRRLWIALKPKEDASDPLPTPAWVEDPPESILPIVETPDGLFWVAARAVEEGDDDEAPIDEEERKWVIGFVDALYRQDDWQEATRTLRVAMDDLSSALEEDGYRVQQGRLEDLGFPPLMRALAIYAPEPASLLRSIPPKTQGQMRLDRPAPLVYLEPLNEGLFQAAMAAIADPAELRRIEADIVPVANSLLVADRVRPGNEEALKASLLKMRGMIELALAYSDPEADAAPGAVAIPPVDRVERAAARLQKLHLRSLFQVGYGLTLKLKTRAQKLDPARFSAEDTMILEGLCRKRPELSALLVAPADPKAGTAPGPANPGERGFAIDPSGLGLSHPAWSLALYEACLCWISELEALDAFAKAHQLAFEGEAESVLPGPEERNLDVLLLTACLRQLLKQGFVAEPLTASELLDLADGLIWVDGQPRLSEERSALATEGLPGALLPRLREALLGFFALLFPHLGKAQVDARYLEGPLRRLD